MFVEFAPGVAAGKHSHPGEELVYITEGTLEYQLDGRPPLTVKAGEVLSIPNGPPHAVKNVGAAKAWRARHLHRRKGQAASRAEVG